MALRSRDEERQRLTHQITEWNSNRVDLFELSLPNEELDFHGVMRFFFQDGTDTKVATKCIRVASTASTRDVLETLVEKFRPDMKMLVLPEYALYEVHVNGDERRLHDNERPLLVQLNWGKDDREGRFLLKRMDQATKPMNSVVMPESGPDIQPGVFKRKLSKREKKEAKKKEKEAKIRALQEKENVAERLYNDLPETSFTRSISNPEAVMQRRRKLKLEKKLQAFKSTDGGPDTGGTLKIYGESIRPDVPYKTLLLSAFDRACNVVKETLEKYGMDKEDPSQFCLVQVVLPPSQDREYHGNMMAPPQEFILDDNDCPLAIMMQYPEHKGTVNFHLRHRNQVQDILHKKMKKGGRLELGDDGGLIDPNTRPSEKMPFLMELNPDGTELPYKAKRHRLQLNVTEVGSERRVSQGGQYLQLHAPDIHPRHAVVAHTEGIVTVTPNNPMAETFVDNKRIFETTMLQNGMVVRFGHNFSFRFCDPSFEEKQGRRMGPGGDPVALGGPPPYDQRGQPGRPADFETNFDVDGHIETVPGQQPMGQFQPPPPEDILPATLEFREEGEDAFLAAVISEVNGNQVTFKLAPTYTIYMATRFRISMAYRPDMDPHERAHRLTVLTNKVAHMISGTIQENRGQAVSLSFWMANASELLHLYKSDGDVGRFSTVSQDVLADSIQTAFRLLVGCMQEELHATMGSFLEDTDQDERHEEELKGRVHPIMHDVLQVLSSAMSLLRRCRVNAALTIQLFSQLFHFLNMWLFNKLVLEPRLRLCTRVWGARLRRRLARVEVWAEKQGLELAADCHLARIIQAAHLLQAPKASRDDITSISSTCFKLNSLQLRALLQNYIPGPDEPHIPQDLINNVVAVAENTADELARSDGREVRLEEEQDLQLPFLLPEDGYSCDIIRGVPNGLAEFLDPLSKTGICRMTVQPMSSGLWTIYMTPQDGENLRAMQPAAPGPGGDAPPQDLPKEPEILTVEFPKVNGSMGLSIVAAKGEGQEKRGIYIKSVVPGGAAALDGRLQAGDQLLEVDGRNLVGLTQDKAAEHMTRTGHSVTLKVAKQGAIYHGLATLLSQPSPVLQRSSPRKSGGAGGKSPRPKSEDAGRFGGPRSESPAGPPMMQQMPPQGRDYPGSPPGQQQQPGGPYGNFQRPISQQHAARSSPALASSRSHEQLRDADPYGSYKQPPMGQSSSHYNLQQEQQQAREAAMRSKSTSHLDHPEPQQQDHRQVQSTSTLPRALQQQQQPGGLHQQQQRHDMNRGNSASQPDLQKRDDPRHNYENYPQQFGGPPGGDRYGPDRYGNQGNHPNYVNHMELRNAAPYQRDQPMQGAVSTPNIRDDHYRGPGPDPSRPRSEDMDHSRVHEWQKRNEMEQARDPYGNQRRMPADYPDAHRSRPEEEVRGPAGGHYMAGYPGQQGRPYEPRRSDMEDPRSKPNIANKPSLAPKPSNKPEPQPQPQRGAPDLRQSQAYDPYGRLSQPPSSEHPTSSYGGNMSYTQANYMAGGTPTPRPQDIQGQYRKDKPSPVGRMDMGTRRDSPELPPPPMDGPPDLPPPPPAAEELPPPPPPPSEYERQIQEEQERMIRSMGGIDLRSPPGGDARHPPNQQQHRPGMERGRPGQQPSPSMYGDRYPVPAPAVGAEQQDTGYQDYQNLPQIQPHNKYEPTRSPYDIQKPSDSRPQYPYRPPSESSQRQQPPRTSDIGSMQKPAPPIAAKPRLFVPKPSDLQKPASPSPWEREEKERETRRIEEQQKQMRDAEIADLEARPYLAAEDEERLRRLRLDQEFQRRVDEMKSKGEDDDSDQDITERPSGRIKVLRMMQDEMERKRQMLAEDRQQREQEKNQLDREKDERTEHRLLMFERERQEQKEREMRRVAKRERETEEYLRKQQDLRERQRREQEEHVRQQRMEDERMREKQREELRVKKEQEREQLREMQLAREAEERALREQARKQEEEANRQRMMERMQEREVQMKNDMERLNRYGHLQYSEPGRGTSPGRGVSPQQPQPQVSTPTSHYGTSPAMQGNTPTSSGLYGPPPPQRNSSYEVANQHGGGVGMRAASSPNIPNEGEPNMINGRNSSSLRPLDNSLSNSAKKSVSFDANLATEINENYRLYGSTSSDNSRDFRGDPNSPSYQYRGSTGSSGSEQPQYFQRGSYGSQSATPTTPSTPQDVFAPRTPDNPAEPQPHLVIGSTPGVVGAQEIYRDPRERIAAQRAANKGQTLAPTPVPERLSFRDKMRMFAAEAGENTPKDRAKISHAQRRIESALSQNGQ